MKKFFAAMLLMLLFTAGSAFAADCTISITGSCIGGSNEIFSVSGTYTDPFTNNHAALNNPTPYPTYKVCCDEFSVDPDPTCSDPDSDIALKFFDTTNSHVAGSDEALYPLNLCLTSAIGAGEINCWASNQLCSTGGGTGIVSISSFTNAHVSQYNITGTDGVKYGWNICCGAVPEPPEAPSDWEFTVTTDKASYVLGDTINVTVKVKNKSTSTKTISLSTVLSNVDTDADFFTEVVPNGDITPDGEITPSYAWDSSALPSGTYYVTSSIFEGGAPVKTIGKYITLLKESRTLSVPDLPVFFVALIAFSVMFILNRKTLKG